MNETEPVNTKWIKILTKDGNKITIVERKETDLKSKHSKFADK